MIHKMFTVYDTAAKAYLPPFFLPREEMAIRVFTDAVNSDSHQFGRHPADYTLFLIAEFDDEFAGVSLQTPEKVCTGLEVLRRPKSPDLHLFEDTDDETA